MAGAIDVGTLPAAAEAALLRTAYLLTGDPRAAEELLTGALAEAAARRPWRRHGRRPTSDDGPDAVVRRALVRRSLRRPARTVHAGVPAPTGGTEELRTGLLGLDPRTRAALVLRLHDGLTEAEAAEALGCSPGAVAALTAAGTAALRGVVPAPGPAPAALTTADGDDGDGGDDGDDDPDALYRRPS